MVLTYPSWFTALDRQRIADAFTKAEALKVLPPDDGGVLVLFIFVWPSDAVAIEGMLIVLEAIAAVLQGHRDRQPVADRRRAADELRDQVIVWADQTRTKKTTTSGKFIAAVETALDAAPWWQQLQPTLVERATTVKTPTRRPDQARLQADRERVVMPLLEELDWNPSRWATHAGVAPAISLGYLAGTRTGKLHRARLTNALIKALGRPIQLPK